MDRSQQSDSEWGRAETFRDLCELGARFLEGDLDSFPGWGAADVDEETDDDFADLLADCCRAGFLTVASQPGAADAPGHDGQVERRRAFVTGFADAGRVEALGALPGLTLTVDHCPELVLGLRGEEPFLVLGPDPRASELELFEDHLSAAGMASLARQSWVVLHDPEWGRTDRLVPALAATLRKRYS